MCILCEAYGTEPIDNEYELQEILKIAGSVMRDNVVDRNHVMEFVNQVTGEGKDFEEDPEIVGTWERNQRSRD